MPSTPREAYGLLLSCIEDPNPVLFMPPKALLRTKGEELIPGEPATEKELRDAIDAPVNQDRSDWKPQWPKLEFASIPLGKAKVVREGNAALLVTYGRHVHLAMKAAENIAAEGLGEVEVLDLRTLYPYDWNCISQLLLKSGRVLFLNEDTEITNFGEHLLRRCVDEHFYQLRARPRLLAGLHVPGIGLAPSLENVSVPQISDIERELRALLSEKT